MKKKRHNHKYTRDERKLALKIYDLNNKILKLKKYYDSLERKETKIKKTKRIVMQNLTDTRAINNYLTTKLKGKYKKRIKNAKSKKRIRTILPHTKQKT